MPKLSIITPLLFLSCFNLNAASTWHHEESDLPVDQAAVFGELENGFKYIIYPNTEPPERVSLRLHIDAGAFHEADDQQGMAHFLEHMVFEGSENYTSAELIPEMQRLGIAFGAHANAYTSFDETVYKLDLPNLEDRTLDLGFTVMRDFCDGALLLEEEVEAERGVILSEKNSRDSVDFRLMKQQFEYLLPDHLATWRFPIGTEDCIKNTSRDRIKDLYDSYYDPQRMTFIVVGDIDVPAYQDKIASIFGSLESPAKPGSDPNLGTITEPSTLRTVVFSDPEVDEEDITITRALKHTSQPETVQTRTKKIQLKIANTILTRRFDQVAKQEGSPIIGGSAYHYTWFDDITFGGISVTPTEGQWPAAVSVIENEFRRALEYGFTQSEVSEVKANYLNAAQAEVDGFATRQSPQISDAIVNSINDRRVITTAETDLRVLEQILSTLSPADCHNAFKLFWDIPGYDLTLTITNTQADDKATLENLYLESQKTQLTAPVEKEVATFAYQSFGSPSTIVSEQHIEDLDFYQIGLSNGIKVNLKQTDFEAGKVYVQVRLGHGLSSGVPTAGLPAFTSSLINLGGLGQHTAEELRQIFASQQVNVSFAIAEDAFILNAQTKQDDLLDQLKLIGAYLTNAGYHDEAVRLYRKSLPDQYEQLEQTLEGAFEKMSAFMHGNATAFQIPSEQEAQALEKEAVINWLNTATKDALIEISIVGDIDIAQVKETLPILGSELARQAPASHTVPDLDLPALGQTHTYTYKSDLDRAAAITTWRIPGLGQNIQEARRLNILSSIITNRMRDEIREKIGASYSPFARAQMSDTFHNYGNIQAISICQPADIDRLNALLMEIGKTLSSEGATQDELDRAKNPALSSIKTSVRSNAYWLSTVLSRSQTQPKRLDWARNRESDYQSISLAEINALAKKYLQPENVIAYRIEPKN